MNASSASLDSADQVYPITGLQLPCRMLLPRHESSIDRDRDLAGGDTQGLQGDRQGAAVGDDA
jgi:hypothetical protein